MEALAYTVAEAAEVTRLSESEIKRHVRSGDIIAARVGRRVLIRPERLNEWLISREAAS